MVVGSSRLAAGRIAEREFDVDVHILDDGFQHWALARDLDIVTVDSTASLSANALLPAGSLREPPAALGRAGMIVLTRTDQCGDLRIETEVRRYAPQAPVFHGMTKLEGLIEARTGAASELGGWEGRSVFAFCGVGNALAFFEDLKRWGFRLAGEKSWRDHHRYSAEEIQALCSRAERWGAAALVTTEKDWMNFPKFAPGRANGLPLLVCRIRAELAEPAEFEQTLMTALGERRALA